MDLHRAHLTKDYTTRGLLGKATDDFSDLGRLVEKTIYDHVTQEKLDRISAVIQGSHQKAVVMRSRLDLKTQGAYELAVKGLIRPMEKTPMPILGIRCLEFSLPKIQCMNETQQRLRRVVHEIGLELKSTAVCTQVRRTRDGAFNVDDALPRTRWDQRSVQETIREVKPHVEEELLKTWEVVLDSETSEGRPASPGLGLESTSGRPPGVGRGCGTAPGPGEGPRGPEADCGSPTAATAPF
ncbi:mitochondrial mRNA pseudouridine synthase TRUB2-like [Ornithorhynchus anatinus]|uniref:mitochondrial mRNA pseudouridine synthase TRUB2-like n=1 Tax=Ornithorhynchus anatinus TaxID=9258 RepID=UPI0001555685|nr:mitochondrial mRNA pseudouridine synthase TRUB2-like [Ornithorhynchus anatinus]